MKTYKALTTFLLFAAIRSATFADTVSLAPQKDTTLYPDAAGQLSNGQGIYLFVGSTGVSGLRRAALVYALSGWST